MTENVQEIQARPTPRKTVKIGNYEVTGKIGEGGIAVIYKARQESLNRDVAIKVLSPNLTSDPDIVRRFERESLLIAQLNHPNIVHVIDKGQAAGRYYFVMDYINGTSLREVIDSTRIPLNVKLEMMVQVCKALDYAHKNGVIHRDIKPANILIDRQGNALVADFGIAQIISTPDSEMTSSDVIMGTMSYMSPEQKVSSTNVDQTTDIYAVGVILYEILCGRKPLGHFKPPSHLMPELNSKFDEITLKCLAQEPKDRYQSAVELKDALLDVLGQDNQQEVPSKLSVSGTESFLGKCRHLDTIRETKFGSTILVENRLTKKLFVIKRHSKGEKGRKEAKLLSSLKHDNIINVVGAGGDSSTTVIISEYAQGGSLADRMLRKYRWGKAFPIILQVVSGLDFAHKNNIMHGNLRPSNILFDKDETIKLCDFGLPPHYDRPQKRNWYSPPERKQSRHGDIYSVGVILYQMLTGRTPTYDTRNNLLLDDLKLELPDAILNMLSKLLAIRVSMRYQSLEDFLLDWDDYDRLRQEHQKRSSQAFPELPAPQQSKAWAFILMALGILAGIFIALYLFRLF